jgi:hypothetical protein
MSTLLRRLAKRLHRFSSDLRELGERRVLLDRPWEEDFLHWARDGQGCQLHGHLVPSPQRRASSVTSRGWCPEWHTDRDYLRWGGREWPDMLVGSGPSLR